ncbi:hypothetical protein [Streptomyces sp. NPDC058867]|uniref:hypothetical protein n=1 Tax=unclassified Streptomyces TaxID=2593676 RepID=UPI0036808C20
MADRPALRQADHLQLLEHAAPALTAAPPGGRRTRTPSRRPPTLCAWEVEVFRSDHRGHDDVRKHGDLADRDSEIASLVEESTRVLGAGHPDTLAAQYTRAEWLSQDGRTDQAEAAFTDLIGKATEHLGPDHDTTLIARSSLAIMRHELPNATPADKTAATDELTSVVTDMARALGTDNPTTANTRRLLDQWTNRTDPLMPPAG